MKPLKLLAMLALALVFTRHDTSACTERDTRNEEQKKKTEFLARSAFKALKAVTPGKADLHPDFMIGNSLLRF
jgi:hypothetical protein